MDDSEKIRDEKIFSILEQLKNDRTILNIHVMGTDFDGLSIILGISDGESPRFFIDNPSRANHAAPLSVGRKCYFEFNDGDRIKYSFKTTIESIFGKRIKFNFPEFIERSQRRKAFRIPVPKGSRLLCSTNNNQFKFDIINVSEGGLLVSIEAISHNSDILFKGKKFKGLLLSAEQADKSVKINLHSAEIVRVEKMDENGRINYGLKFIDIEKRDQDELRRFIYYCQRRILKKRGGLNS